VFARSARTPNRPKFSNKLLGTLAVGTALALPAAAAAHLERPSYWPDPAPDTSVSPPAGGEVPDARGLASAVTGKGPGEVLVVCKGEQASTSLRLLRKSLSRATGKGFFIRPSQPKYKLSQKQADRLTRINRALAEDCDYNSIQNAVFDAHNNARVVIMPGRYTEPKSRNQPLNDPRCTPSLLQQDASGDPTPSYRYQATCPNDQNLIYVQGREVVGEPPSPPLADRQGIPAQELGKCVRCNLQLEGSGAQPTDVIIDGGRAYGSKDPEAKPGEVVKDVIIRADRADGFVVRNLTTRGALEHGIYVEETDGYRIERTKMFWAADYGNLTFTSDHGLYKNCDSFGAGDAALYPGAAPETGAQASSFYPDAPRANTVVKKCDMRGSALGYSGSMGNAVRITDNHIYGNTTGIASDTLSAAGHPGFPADSSQIDNNLIYSNNLDLYREDAPIKILVTVPIGTGIIYAGMNDARVHDNWIFDNWRNGTFLLAVPDALTNGGGAEGQINPGVSCPGAPDNGLSTSCNNQYYGNHMGQAPQGFKFPKALDQFGVPHAASATNPLPNGNDFWWDEFSGNTGNCWFGNTGSDGTEASVTGPGGPGMPPDMLPSDCASSVGPGDGAKTNYLIDCSDGPDEETGPLDCDWWQPPPPPQSAAAAREQRRAARAAARWEQSAEADALRDRLAELGFDG
jgi:Right handed beta helix region